MRFIDENGNELPFTVRCRGEVQSPWLDLIGSTKRYVTATVTFDESYAQGPPDVVAERIRRFGF